MENDSKTFVSIDVKFFTAVLWSIDTDRNIRYLEGRPLIYQAWHSCSVTNELKRRKYGKGMNIRKQ